MRTQPGVTPSDLNDDLDPPLCGIRLLGRDSARQLEIDLIGFVGLDRPNRAKEPVLLPIRTGREEQRIGRTVVRRSVTELEGPQSVDHDRLLLRVPQRTTKHEVAVWLFLICVDPAVAEVADEQVSPEAATVLGRHREAPWRVQVAMTRDADEQATRGV